ncbi:MADS-box transcription factor 30, partial [Dichanthelium oligosanthes]
MGRGKVEMKRIENRVSRQVTFSKRRKGLLKKAHELAVLCDVDVGLVFFSERGRMFQYPNPPTRLTLPLQQEMIAEIGKLRHEYEQLEASLRAYTGEDLSALDSVDELDELEQQLESALSKVRARKDELLIDLTNELQLKVTETLTIKGNARHDAAVETEEVAEPLPPSPSFAYLLNVNETSAASTMLQLWPQTDDDDDDVRGSSTPPPPRGLQL